MGLSRRSHAERHRPLAPHWRIRVTADAHALVPALKDIATRLRIDSIRATTAAGSGHPSSCCSAADIVAALFFAEMRFDPRRPQDPDNDRFVMSKGHAAPLLYAAWAEAGAFDRAELLKLREIGSDLEGHPTPAAAVRRRRHGLARPGHLRGRRHRAQRAAHRVCLPDLRAARRRRVGRRLGVGGGRRRRSTTSWPTCAASPTSTRWARAR